VIPRISQVHIKDYKSIARATVELGDLCVLVGPNGAGKSNFVDALSFVHDCLAQSVDLAFANRGGIAAVRRLSTGHPTHIGIRMIIELSDEVSADYSFEIAARPTGRFEVARERCAVRHVLGHDDVFEVRSGVFVREIPGIKPRLEPDRLTLYAASGVEEFRPVYDFLTSMRFYSVEPGRMREYQEPDAGEVLRRDGSNAAAVLKRVKAGERNGHHAQLLHSALGAAIQGIVDVDREAVGQRETIVFRQDIGTANAWKFEAMNMSDGTLRLLGLLLALYQPSDPRVVTIEEPESTLHPALTELVVQILRDASEDRQILVTTHSPDILDNPDLEDEHLRVVTSDHNRTMIARVSPFGRDAIRRKLYTAGELLRSNDLNPDEDDATGLANQLGLFDAAPPR